MDFLGRAVQGDFGRSLKYNVPASTLIRERLPSTITLAVSAVIVSALIGIPLGVLAAVKRGSWIDDVVILTSTLGLAAPSFWIGTMLIVVLAVQLRLLPPSGGGSLDKLIMPTMTLASGFIAVLARFTRSGMLDVLSKEYVTTARAKGLPNRVVLFRHALRNTMIPIVTLLGLEMGTLLGGAVVTENVFAWPGIGQLVVMSIFNRDYPLVIACVLTAATLFIIVNLLVDILYVYQPDGPAVMVAGCAADAGRNLRPEPATPRSLTSAAYSRTAADGHLAPARALARTVSGQRIVGPWRGTASCLGGVITMFLILMAVLGPVIAPYSPIDVSLESRLFPVRAGQHPVTARYGSVGPRHPQPNPVRCPRHGFDCHRGGRGLRRPAYCSGWPLATSAASSTWC